VGLSVDTCFVSKQVARTLLMIAAIAAALDCGQSYLVLSSSFILTNGDPPRAIMLKACRSHLSANRHANQLKQLLEQNCTARPRVGKQENLSMKLVVKCGDFYQTRPHTASNRPGTACSRHVMGVSVPDHIDRNTPVHFTPCQLESFVYNDRMLVR
jgi:hypothetical protein